MMALIRTFPVSFLSQLVMLPRASCQPGSSTCKVGWRDRDKGRSRILESSHKLSPACCPQGSGLLVGLLGHWESTRLLPGDSEIDQYS